MPMGKGYYKYEAKADSAPNMGGGMQAESPRKKFRKGKKKGRVVKNSAAKSA